MSRASVESPFIVRAPRMKAGEDAHALVAEARERAASMLAEAEAEVACLRAGAEVEIGAKAEAAYAEALARGRGEAAAEAAVLVAQTAESLDRFWRERENELRDLALAVSHRVLAALPGDEMLVRLAAEAITEHRSDTQLALKVTPDMVDHLREALSTSAYGDRVAVLSDPSLPAGGCTLLHPQGRTEVGLLAQFRAMLAAGEERR